MVGAPTLLPGLSNHLSLLFPPTVPITSALDPSQVIAVGCALQAYHLTQLPKDSIDPTLQCVGSKTSAAPIGLVFPDQASQDDQLHALVIPAGIRLPCRRLVEFEVAPGTSKVSFEIWEGKTDISVEQKAVEKTEQDEEEFSDEEEEEPEEIRTVLHRRTQLLAAGEVEVEGKTSVVLGLTLSEEGIRWSTVDLDVAATL